MAVTQNSLTQAPITKSLLKLATPMIIAFSFQTSFNFIDRYFVSRLGDTATAAIGMAFIIQLVIIALGAGLGMGLNSFISRNLGANRKEDAVQAALHSFLLAGLVGILLSIFGFLTYKPIFALLGASGLLMENITDYLTTIFIFIPIYMMGMFSNNIFRGWGNTFYPMKFMIFGTLLNIIFDPILIFGWGIIPAFGIRGAALATGIARTFALVYTLFPLFVKGIPIKLKFSFLKLDWRIFRGIFQVGLPSSLGQVITSFSISLIFLILKDFGDEARAAYTISFTYEMVAFLPALGIAQAISILTGHNYGAGLYTRIRSVYYSGLLITIGIMLVITVIISIAPHFFAAVFARGDDTLLLTATALRIMAPGYLLSGVFLCTVSSFQGLGLGTNHLLATIFRIVLFILPLAWLGSVTMGINGVWIGILAGNLLTTIIIMYWYRHFYYKKLITGRVNTL